MICINAISLCDRAYNGATFLVLYECVPPNGPVGSTVLQGGKIHPYQWYLIMDVTPGVDQRGMLVWHTSMCRAPPFSASVGVCVCVLVCLLVLPSLPYWVMLVALGPPLGHHHHAHACTQAWMTTTAEQHLCGALCALLVSMLTWQCYRLVQRIPAPEQLECRCSGCLRAG